MAQERAAFSGRAGSPNRRLHPDVFAFMQATEHYLAASPSELPPLSVLGNTRAARDLPDALDRWTMAKHDKRSVALKRLAPSQRRRVSAFASLLTDGTPEQCETVAQSALDEFGGDAQSVAVALFAPAARMLGERWCADECSFMSVTMGVSHMQRMFRMMISETPTESLRGEERSILLAPAPGEQHSFGLSIVDDAFRRAGWDVDCCGCGEERQLFRLASVNFYSVIGISISTERLLPPLTSLIAKLRMRSVNKSVIVIAGGSLAIEKPQAAIDVGFDFFAITARSAVTLSESVLASKEATAHAAIAAE